MASNPFEGSSRTGSGLERRDLVLSGAIHGGILLLFVVAGLLAGGSETVPMGGGEFVSVEMVVLEHGTSQAGQVEAVEEQVEQTEEVTEVIEEQVEEVVEEVTEPVQEEEVVEEQVEEPVQEEAPAQDFIGVGSQGEAGSGAPGPASYEGRVFSAIRRNFRTSVNPPQSYRLVFTVNLDGTTSSATIRNSGDSGFDRAVTHALNSANIPPVPPGRTEPVQLSIEFFGPDPL